MIDFAIGIAVGILLLLLQGLFMDKTTKAILFLIVAIPALAFVTGYAVEKGKQAGTCERERQIARKTT